jgi:hypothetical protein
MLEELKKLVSRVPFVPFRITMSSGLQISVRSREHIIVGSKGNLVVVEDDEGLFEILPLLHITSLQAREPAL